MPRPGRPSEFAVLGDCLLTIYLKTRLRPDRMKVHVSFIPVYLSQFQLHLLCCPIPSSTPCY
ncbi:uncharacterized protein MYCFIDRAFT_171596 [Pseudocercospora fijiensis CIRAD86]|uniref:Uncharacterized protein n=1 Tax=Pseudocercospora fijiensis (strain CIRAD86) TaxID=383855 RepID=M3AMB1_PSEFD|nr:uncharacterized protein MYCFIDRAFT_171596 [Pseudocercospora fijiensis CIRAD86]EME85716.1 hypothetical protein MYCFIDRAFT_171596 [Pseudocercospora fijiensis CIRAD86]